MKTIYTVTFRNMENNSFTVINMRYEQIMKYINLCKAMYNEMLTVERVVEF